MVDMDIHVIIGVKDGKFKIISPNAENERAALEYALKIKEDFDNIKVETITVSIPYSIQYADLLEYIDARKQYLSYRYDKKLKKVPKKNRNKFRTRMNGRTAELRLLRKSIKNHAIKNSVKFLLEGKIPEKMKKRHWRDFLW